MGAVGTSSARTSARTRPALRTTGTRRVWPQRKEPARSSVVLLDLAAEGDVHLEVQHRRRVARGVRDHDRAGRPVLGAAHLVGALLRGCHVGIGGEQRRGLRASLSPSTGSWKVCPSILSTMPVKYTNGLPSTLPSALISLGLVSQIRCGPVAVAGRSRPRVRRRRLRVRSDISYVDPSGRVSTNEPAGVPGRRPPWCRSRGRAPPKTTRAAHGAGRDHAGHPGRGHPAPAAARAGQPHDPDRDVRRRGQGGAQPSVGVLDPRVQLVVVHLMPLHHSSCAGVPARGRARAAARCRGRAGS